MTQVLISFSGLQSSFILMFKWLHVQPAGGRLATILSCVFEMSFFL